MFLFYLLGLVYSQRNVNADLYPSQGGRSNKIATSPCWLRLFQGILQKLSSGQNPNSQIFYLVRKVFSIILLSVGYILPVYICVSTVQAPSNLMSAPACFWMPHSRPASSHWAPPHLYPSDGGGQRPRLVQSPTVVGLWATRILPISPKHHQICSSYAENLRTPLWLQPWQELT